MIESVGDGRSLSVLDKLIDWLCDSVALVECEVAVRLPSEELFVIETTDRVADDDRFDELDMEHEDSPVDVTEVDAVINDVSEFDRFPVKLNG